MGVSTGVDLNKLFAARIPLQAGCPANPSAPGDLLKKTYASLNLDIEEGKKWVSLNFSGA